MIRYEPGDRVLVNVTSGTGAPPDWRLATVLRPTSASFGWTYARTDCGISRGPGWDPDEIQLVEPER